MRITHVKIPSFSQCDVICSTLLLHQLHSVQNYLQPNLLRGSRHNVALPSSLVPEVSWGSWDGTVVKLKCSTLANVARVQFPPGARCGLSLLLVLVLLRRFSVFSSFPSSTKTNTSNSNYRAPAWKPAEPAVASSLNIFILICSFCC